MTVSLLTICYLFLGGTGAGAVFWLALLELASGRQGSVLQQASASLRLGGLQLGSVSRQAARWRDEASPFFFPSYTVALLALMLGMGCLLIDLGRIDRVLNLFLHPTLTYLSVGSYALALLLLCVVGLTAAWAFPSSGLSPGRLQSAASASYPSRLRAGWLQHWIYRVFLVLSLLAAAAVMLYTGLLFWSIGEGVLLGSPLVPALFVLSALSCGLACVVGALWLVGTAERFTHTLRNLARIDLVLVSAELVLLVLLLGWAGESGLAAEVEQLLSGSFREWFWAGVVMAGLAVPIVASIGEIAAHRYYRVRFGFKLSLNRTTASSPLLAPSPLLASASACALIGGFCLRYVLITVGLPLFTP